GALCCCPTGARLSDGCPVVRRAPRSLACARLTCAPFIEMTSTRLPSWGGTSPPGSGLFQGWGCFRTEHHQVVFAVPQHGEYFLRVPESRRRLLSEDDAFNFHLPVARVDVIDGEDKGRHITRA